MRYMLASLLAGICLAATCDSRACGMKGGDVKCRACGMVSRETRQETRLLACSVSRQGRDYTVTRGTTIESQRPIWLLVTEAGWGVVNGRDQRSRTGWLEEVGSVDTTLSIDGQPAPGIGGVASAAWRLGAFVVWNADGRIERRTRATVRGHSVTIDDSVANGRIWMRVVIGPPLGDRRVRYAVLELEATENDGITLGGMALQLLRDRRWWDSRTRIQVTCSAVLDLPFRCRFVRRVAERNAGGPLRERCLQLADAGRSAVNAGHDAMPEIVEQFIDIVTTRQAVGR